MDKIKSFIITVNRYIYLGKCFTFPITSLRSLVKTESIIKSYDLLLISPNVKFCFVIDFLRILVPFLQCSKKLATFHIAGFSREMVQKLKQNFSTIVVIVGNITYRKMFIHNFFSSFEP